MKALTKAQATMALVVMVEEVERRLNMRVDRAGTPSHAAFLDAVYARLRGLHPPDTCRWTLAPIAKGLPRVVCGERLGAATNECPIHGAQDGAK